MAAARQGPGPAKLALAATAAVALLLVLAAAGLYAARLTLARDAAARWLKRQGVEAEVGLRALGPTRAEGRVRIGPADRPDLVIESLEVDYSLSSYLRGEGLKVSAVRARRPVLAARWRDGRLDLGAVDALIAAARRRGPGGAGPLPRILVEQGRVRLDSAYGLLEARADAAIDEGRLTSLDGALAPARLQARGLQAELAGATVRARRTGDALGILLQAQAPRAAAGEAEVQGAALRLQATLAYDALMRGTAAGRASADLVLPRARAGASSASDLRLALVSPDLRIEAAGRQGGGRFDLKAQAAEISAADLRLTQAVLEGAGEAQAGPKAITARWTGSAGGRGRWPALGAPAADDAPVMAAVKRALADFRWGVERAELRLGEDGFDGRLLRPARVAAASGGTLAAAPAGTGYRLTVTGGGLPEARADVRRVSVSGGRVTADGRVTAAFTLGVLQDARIAAAGTLSLAGGETRFAGRGCAEVSAERLDFGENAAEAFRAELCPASGPLLALGGGRWTIAGRARGASVRVPFLETALSEGEGRVRLSGRGAALSAEAEVERARASDLALKTRYWPMLGSGRIALANGRWTGALDVRLPSGAAVAHADLTHDVDAMRGGVKIATPILAFAPGGLQPSQLSPLTAALGEPVTGTVSFAGDYAWAGGRTSSGGRLTAHGLDFRSPLGPMAGFSGAMTFTSLAPLAGATDGPVRAERLDALVPLTEVQAVAAVADETIVVSEAQGAVGGGLARARATLPFDEARPIRGEVSLERVQVHDLIEASPFGDRVDMTAELSGRIPFESLAGRVRVSDGALRAVGPGRLSISRAALNPAGAAGAQTSPFSDIAYQAMENLAFDTLDATVASRPDGRLGMVFHIAGRHDPPARQEIALSWLDLLRRNFLDRKLPLPSGTEVKLTLDTTLNLDDLIQDYGALRRPGGSSPVQPGPSILDQDPRGTGR